VVAGGKKEEPAPKGASTRSPRRLPEVVRERERL
jgi:hypothetical protein